MSFAHPALLAALGLALAPILLHLLSLRPARRIRFSELRLIRAAESQARPRRRLRSWLLAACRSLIVAALVSAYAGPVAAPEGAAAAAGTLDLALLVDVSYSMGCRRLGKTRLETAAAAAERLLSGLAPGDRVAVAAFSDRLETEGRAARWATPAEASAELRRAVPGHRGTDYAPALKAAYALLAARGPAGSGRRGVVLLLSDGAAHAVRGPLPAPAPGVIVANLDWEETPANGWIAAARPSARSSPRQPELEFEVASAGQAPAATPLSLRLGSWRTSSASLRPNPGVSETVGLRLPPSPLSPPAWRGTASLGPDALPEDDNFHVSLRHAAVPKILCLYGEPSFLRAPQGGYFLQRLLGGERGSLLNFECVFAEWSALEAGALSSYQAVILADFRLIAPQAAAALAGFVRAGGALAVFPGGGGEPVSGEALAALLPARLGPVATSPRPRGLAGGGSSWSGYDTSQVAVWRHLALAAAPGAEAVVRSAAGAPLWVTGRHGAGRVGVAAFALDASWTNLAVKPLFAAFMRDALAGLLPEPGPRTETLQLSVGEPIRLSWPSDRPAPSRVTVRSPDGRRTHLRPRDRRVEFQDTLSPGLYSVEEDGGGGERVYAVNLDRARESDLAPAQAPAWRGLRPDSLPEDFRLWAYGRDLRGHALGAAAVLLALEMLLAWPRRKAGPALEVPSARTAAGMLLLLLAAVSRVGAAEAPPAGRFVWSQLKLGSDWDPYPGVHGDVLELFGKVTSVLTHPERRGLVLEDSLLLESPLVVLAGRGGPAALPAEQRQRLRGFLSAGGMIWIEDVSGSPGSAFDRWTRKLLRETFPEAELKTLEPDHAVYKSFFLLRKAAGRVALRPTLEGLDWGGRTAVLYSRNDILGAWAKDALGRPLLPCVPGGEAQRHEARKLALNILMFSLTGTYKTDAVHQPFLLEKLRSGEP